MGIHENGFVRGQVREALQIAPLQCIESFALARDNLLLRRAVAGGKIMACGGRAGVRAASRPSNSTPEITTNAITVKAVALFMKVPSDIFSARPLGRFILRPPQASSLSAPAKDRT
jgi:hypothetical protein